MWHYFLNILLHMNLYNHYIWPFKWLLKMIRPKIWVFWLRCKLISFYILYFIFYILYSFVSLSIIFLFFLLFMQKRMTLIGVFGNLFMTLKSENKYCSLSPHAGLPLMVVVRTYLIFFSSTFNEVNQLEKY